MLLLYQHLHVLLGSFHKGARLKAQLIGSLRVTKEKRLGCVESNAEIQSKQTIRTREILLDAFGPTWKIQIQKYVSKE